MPTVTTSLVSPQKSDDKALEGARGDEAIIRIGISERENPLPISTEPALSLWRAEAVTHFPLSWP